MYFVYILECSDGTYYTGSTSDLAKRLHAHNHLVSGARYTKTRRPVVLKYNEAFVTLSQALKREIQIKTWPRKRKERLLLQ